MGLALERTLDLVVVDVVVDVMAEVLLDSVEVDLGVVLEVRLLGFGDDAASDFGVLTCLAWAFWGRTTSIKCLNFSRSASVTIEGSVFDVHGLDIFIQFDWAQ